MCRPKRPHGLLVLSRRPRIYTCCLRRISGSPVPLFDPSHLNSFIYFCAFHSFDVVYPFISLADYVNIYINKSSQFLSNAVMYFLVCFSMFYHTSISTVTLHRHITYRLIGDHSVGQGCRICTPTEVQTN
jgi:hypothetical protein